MPSSFKTCHKAFPVSLAFAIYAKVLLSERRFTTFCFIRLAIRKMQMSSRSFAFAVIMAFSLSGLCATSALAHPPGWHRPPPAKFHHRHHYGWLWVPAIAGVTIWGLSSIHSAPRIPYDAYVPYRYRVAPSSVAPTNGSDNVSDTEKTLYWCEAEKGFYPQVRACPTGWTPVPAP